MWCVPGESVVWIERTSTSVSTATGSVTQTVFSSFGAAWIGPTVSDSACVPGVVPPSVSGAPASVPPPLPESGSGVLGGVPELPQPPAASASASASGSAARDAMWAAVRETVATNIRSSLEGDSLPGRAARASRSRAGARAREARHIRVVMTA